MTQARLDDRCPLCGRYVASGSGLPNHLPDCPAREDVLAELEDRARQARKEGGNDNPGQRRREAWGAPGGRDRSERRSGGGRP